MSGRFTFTAGNTLTAAQLNTNVMDGIPYKIVAGVATVTGSLAITFPSAFPSAPIMTGNAQGGTAGHMVTFVPTSTGATIYVWNATSTAATVARNIAYQAIFMTSTTAAGNS
jgi:hypothetical protein